MKKVIITGANSFVGTHIENWLQQQPEKYLVHTRDMLDGSWEEMSFAGYNVVFHVAGIAHVKAKRSQEAIYYKVNTDLAIETAKKAKAADVRQFIFMSSMIVYGESKSLKPVLITKDTQPSPNGFYGNSKLQAEIGIQQLEDENFKVAILRPPMIYGPGSKGNFPRLVALAKKTLIFPAYHNQRSMLYIDNLSEFIRLVIDHESRGIFFPQNAEYVDTTEVVLTIAQFQNRRIAVLKILNPLVLLFSYFVPQLNKLFGTFVYDSALSTPFDEPYHIMSFQQSLEEVSRNA